MKNKVVLTAVLGYLSKTVVSQGVQCSASRNRWGLSTYNKQDTNCWLNWSGWSQCTGHCGQAVKTANRKCRGNIPGLGGCQGSELRRKRCSASEMIQGKNQTYCPYWSFWSEWSGCQVQPSTDPCIRNVQGFARRTRTCHDPYATERGETPNCQGEEFETRVCQGSPRVVVTPYCNVPAGEGPPEEPCYRYEDRWSVCSNNCGLGTQSSRLVHQCANVPGTWVSKNEWYKMFKRECSNSCCEPGEWQLEEKPAKCFVGYIRRTRTWMSFIGGPNDATPGQDCQSIAQSNPNLRPSVGNQFVEEIFEPVPVVFPQPNQHDTMLFFCNEPQWSVCTPQQSPYGNGLTTCNMNGIRTRTWKHCCAQECESKNQYNSLYSRPIAGSECETWLQPPYVQIEQEACGPTVDVVNFNTCSIDPCNPVCTQRLVCGNEIFREIPRNCSVNECGPLKPQQCNNPAPCTCGQQFKTKTCTQQCMPDIQIDAPCPANTVQTYTDDKWSETIELISARNSRLCICKFDKVYMDFKFTWSKETSEDGTICSTHQIQRETRNNIYAQESCLSEEVCQMDMCDRTCDMPNQGPQMYTCFRQDACRDPNNNLVPTQTRECPPKQSCCIWTKWEVNQTCSNIVQCPSEANGHRQLIRREINSLTGKQDENCYRQETDEEPCPTVACPAWPNWSEWSQCSYILPDGTVCGGNRRRKRHYDCKNDVAQGKCLPSYSPGRSYSDGNYDNHYEQIDAFSENHHSAFCYDLYEKSDTTVTILMNQGEAVANEAWQWFRDPVDKGCITGNSTHYREYREYQIYNKCIRDEKPVTLKEYRYVPIPNCVNQIIPQTQLNTCGSGFPGPCCLYDNNGCSATVQSECIATDDCSQNRPAMSQRASEIQCPTMDEQIRKVESSCEPTEDPTDDYCAGTCEVTVFWKCGTQTNYKRNCTIEPEWTPWTPFTALIPFDISTAIPMQTYDENNALTPINVLCNPCGGQLQSSRVYMCSAQPYTDEIRAIECPKPSFPWSEWSECGDVCANLPNKRNCTQTRYRIASPGTEHCQEQEMDTRTRTIHCPPCQCVRREKICKHQYSPNATCGTGHYHERVYKNGCDCVTRKVTNIDQEPDTVLYINELGQTEPCELEYQPQWVSGPKSGCDTLEQTCNGGPITQRRTLRCVEGVAPNGFQEKIKIDLLDRCPEQPVVSVTQPEYEGCQNQCQKTQNVKRKCIGGRFEDNCDCMLYGRECCQRDPEYTLINNGTEEVKTVPCRIQMIWEEVDIRDPKCECGICGYKRCEQNPCTGEYRNCDIYESQPGSYEPKIFPLGECQWEQGQDKCDIIGYQLQKCEHYCIDNIIQDPPKITYNTVRFNTSTDSATGFTYNSINGPVTTEYRNLQNCKLQREHQRKTSECIYTDRCNPYKLVEYFSICDGIQTLISSTQQACEIKQPVKWGPWSKCSVECGAGVMTRQLIEGFEECTRKVLDTEEKPCGCGIARWSEWSEWVGTYDSCGSSDQVRTSSRTCIEAQSNSYVYSTADQYVTYLSNGYYKTRINSAIDSECANKCNQCIGDQVRRELLTVVPAPIYNQTESCPVDPRDRCTTPYVLNKFIQCNKIIRTEQIPCPLPQVQIPPPSECSVLCGQGTKTVTTQTSFCEVPVTIEIPCIGRLGKEVERPATSWSVCSKSCGGGLKTSSSSVTCELPDEQGQLVELRKKISTEPCSQHPCAYWGGWSSWSMCSSTCGAGQRQRSRKCEGGAPGTGGCTAIDEYFEVNGQKQAFTPVSNGAVHTIACDDGPCCDFEWSGWSNCCIHGSKQKKLRWKGNDCTGEWRSEDKPCGDVGSSELKSLRQCSDLFNIINHKSYVTEQTINNLNTTQQPVRIRNENLFITEELTNGYINQKHGWNVYYGRRIDDGMYRIGEHDYVLKNNGDQQSWFMLNVDNTQSKVDVEMFQSKQKLGQGYSLVHYYRFGNIWYKYVNNNFAYYGISPPPFYMENSSRSSAVQSVVTDYSLQNIVSTKNYLMPHQYTVASTQSSGSPLSSSYNYVKPVASSQPEVTITKAKPIVSNNSAQKMEKSPSSSSSSSIPSAADAPNANSLFGSW